MVSLIELFQGNGNISALLKIPVWVIIAGFIAVVIYQFSLTIVIRNDLKKYG